MFQEGFEVEVKKSVDIGNMSDLTDDDYSDLTDDDSVKSTDDENQTSILDYLITAFGRIATVTSLGNCEFQLDFSFPNTVLIEENNEYDFDIIDSIPILDDVAFFIPFVNFLKENEPALTGSVLYTNLEGGGNLVI
jgi:hypothetical protein